MNWKMVSPFCAAGLLRKLRRGAGGQSLIEFAFILPLFMLLFMAIVQFGAFFAGLLALNAAAREGARLAAVSWQEENMEQKVGAAVGRVYRTGLFWVEKELGDNLEIEYIDENGNTAGSPTAGGAVRVTVDGEVHRFLPLPRRQAELEEAAESILNISGTAVMRLEEQGG